MTLPLSFLRQDLEDTGGFCKGAAVRLKQHVPGWPPAPQPRSAGEETGLEVSVAGGPRSDPVRSCESSPSQSQGGAV